MPINELIARGIEPIGRDLPQVAGMLEQRRQSNALMDMRRGEFDYRRTQDANALKRQQAEEAKAQQTEKLKQALAQVEWALQPGVTKADIERAIPDVVRGFESIHGPDTWASADDAAIKQSAAAARIQLSSALGIGPKNIEAEAPSTVQEWEYFNRLTPVEQSRFLEMKRNPTPPQIVNIGGAPVMVDRTSQGYGGQTPLSTPEVERTAAAQTAAATATAKTTAEKQAEAAVDLPRKEGLANDMIAVLDQLDKSDLRLVYGPASLLPVIPGTPQADAVAIWEQIQGKVFLEAYSTLKGGGQITEVEGKKATAAITRLSNRKQSPESAKAAIRELKTIVGNGLERARKQAGGVQPSISGKSIEGKKLSPAEAAQLPAGTKFIGTDGIERVKH